mmetsp:Transcript_8014/g.28158  ORF Transcript_8014/g.28158 Transcript_8014/m.28158 type:complete len:727 (-) Transcript_8014:393-2573(-)|eukprot:CAMPEP_0183795788 /NCGR_PEP_ID=MMETSP0803_2-20130417/5319_1 /TAXON_ID=195967 /ORGANISM="Crustomastix stigmata, Strain CCMP3273" /LENGTH=726 /DNA_ID=CAMNT_0026040283 /DNA_START=173 /DNA_END=2353 /DNA_ORIENTATION=+
MQLSSGDGSPNSSLTYGRERLLQSVSNIGSAPTTVEEVRSLVGELRCGQPIRVNVSLSIILKTDVVRIQGIVAELEREGGVDALLQLCIASECSCPLQSEETLNSMECTKQGETMWLTTQCRSSPPPVEKSNLIFRMRAASLRVLRILAKIHESIAISCIEPCLQILGQHSDEALHHHAAYVLRNCMHHSRQLAQRIRDQGGIGLLLSLLSRSQGSPYHRDTAAWAIFKCVCKDSAAAVDVRALGGIKQLLSASDTLACARAVTKCAESDTGAWPCLLQSGLASRLCKLISCMRHTVGQTNWAAVFLRQLMTQISSYPALGILACETGIITALCQLIRLPPVDDSDGAEVCAVACDAITIFAGRIDALWPIVRDNLIPSVLAVASAGNRLREVATTRHGLAILAGAANQHRLQVAQGLAYICATSSHVVTLMLKIEAVEILCHTLCDRFENSLLDSRHLQAASAIQALAKEMASCNAMAMQLMTDTNTQASQHAHLKNSSSLTNADTYNRLPHASGQKAAGISVSEIPAGHHLQANLAEESCSRITVQIGNSKIDCDPEPILACSSLFKDLLAISAHHSERTIPLPRVAQFSEKRMRELFNMALDFINMATVHTDYVLRDLIDLAIFANCFQMEVLQQRCESLLFKRLELNANLLSYIFEVAHTHNLQKLEESCISFMLHNLAELMYTSQVYEVLNMCSGESTLGEVLINLLKGKLSFDNTTAFKT